MLFLGNPDSLSLTLGGPVVLLVCAFKRQDNLLAWHKLFTNLHELKSPIDFERNTSTLSEFIGYANVMDFREILPAHSRIMTNARISGYFDI